MPSSHRTDVQKCQNNHKDAAGKIQDHTRIQIDGPEYLVARDGVRHVEIELQKQQMLKDVQGEISDLAVSIASKVVEKEVSRQEYDGFVDDFIRNVGEQP